jgi:hypothetical protein
MPFSTDRAAAAGRAAFAAIQTSGVAFHSRRVSFRRSLAEIVTAAAGVGLVVACGYRCRAQNDSGPIADAACARNSSDADNATPARAAADPLLL